MGKKIFFVLFFLFCIKNVLYLQPSAPNVPVTNDASVMINWIAGSVVLALIAALGLILRTFLTAQKEWIALLSKNVEKLTEQQVLIQKEVALLTKQVEHLSMIISENQRRLEAVEKDFRDISNNGGLYKRQKKNDEDE